jgi:uncharacterized membrane protein YphA (DoxX/SURF4 family)
MAAPNDLRGPDSMRAPDRALAALRIVVGLWFLKGVVTKLGVLLVGGVLPLPGAQPRWLETMPRLITRYAEDNPFGFYRDFLTNTVLPNSDVFAHLTAVGETAVGIGLTLGLLTPVASLLALFLVATYGLLTSHVGPSQQGFHLLLAASVIAFLLARAGRRWGLDARLHARGPRWLRALT